MSIAAEPVRLVIWDLDETFWGGTLTEGGITWREANAETVRALSARGIINSICSKNDPAAIEALLRERGLREHFIMPSVDWSAKGPRLAALITAIGLRPESCLFIDDNPLNRAEAAHFVPGLQIADEHCVPGLLADPRLAGKPDPELRRLQQYQLLERRQEDRKNTSGGTEAFLRASNITVRIEYDLAAHGPRIVELINRTNQLNFTKQRLPEDPAAAAAELAELLADHTIQAGLVHVRDNYGDYGFVGFYALRRTRRLTAPHLIHFAFSCRTLGMAVETWLYRQLGRPELAVVGEVLTDVINDTREIDWVRLAPKDAAADAETALTLGRVVLRGGCDMRAIGHYLRLSAQEVIEEFADVVGDMTPLSSGSLLAAHALRGVPEPLIADAGLLGFTAAHFHSAVAAAPPADVWLLNFTLEIGVPLLRHKATGCLLPAFLRGYRGRDRGLLAADPAASGVAAGLQARLRHAFEDAPDDPDQVFAENLRLILSRAPASCCVIILLANEIRRGPDGGRAAMPVMRRRNDAIRAVVEAANRPGIHLLRPSDVMTEDEILALERPHHYDRLVYFRLYEKLLSLVAASAAVLQAEPISL